MIAAALRRLSFSLRLPPLRRWAQVARERRALAALPPHLLRDIGLTNGEAASEAARRPWDAPRREAST